MRQPQNWCSIVVTGQMTNPAAWRWPLVAVVVAADDGDADDVVDAAAAAAAVGGGGEDSLSGKELQRRWWS